MFQLFSLNDEGMTRAMKIVSACSGSKFVVSVWFMRKLRAKEKKKKKE